ncbi:hypothetical protein DB31_5979 [Hyalangium minutum]|uniref:Uncharacterized protein n=1 Tax=Hyalangium minutum TaxID=394096 RepID=A0A085VXE5_9BACT|nr:hypothetical protein DB31_5979 [Hyalangium minutum]
MKLLLEQVRTNVQRASEELGELTEGLPEEQGHHAQELSVALGHMQGESEAAVRRAHRLLCEVDPDAKAGDVAHLLGEALVVLLEAFPEQTTPAQRAAVRKAHHALKRGGIE